MDGVVDPAITIKAIGHQWYWSAPLDEGDGSATKCTGLLLQSTKHLAYRMRDENQGKLSSDVERLKGLEHAKNGRLRCYPCIEKAPLANEKPMVPFPKSLEVYIPASSIGNIQEMDAQLAMSNDSAEVVNLSTPQLVAYNFEPNRPDPVISGMGDPRHVDNNHSSYKTTGGGTRPKVDCSCSAFLGDGGPTVGNSKHEHFTEGDQRLYSTRVSTARSKERCEIPFRWKLRGHRELTISGNGCIIPGKTYQSFRFNKGYLVEKFD